MGFLFGLVFGALGVLVWQKGRAGALPVGQDVFDRLVGR